MTIYYTNLQNALSHAFESNIRKLLAAYLTATLGSLIQVTAFALIFAPILCKIGRRTFAAERIRRKFLQPVFESLCHFPWPTIRCLWVFTRDSM